MKLRTLSLTALATLLAAAAITPAKAASATFVVTSAGASREVPGTLTWAVYQANYLGADINYINFNIPGTTGETEIVLTEPLYVARPMVLNAGTQSGNPDYAGPPLIRINCNQFASGFTIVPAGSGLPGGGGSTIRGFRIINYSSNAITIFKGADSNLIANNHIGFAPLPVPGTYFKNTTVAPECRGIGMESSSNVIRGNTISGVHNGITLAGDIFAQPPKFCRNNSIHDNFIGTDPTGTTQIGNASDAIFLTAGAQENLIGPGNVLSGNASAGVELLDAAATNNRIFGNNIGVNAAGTGAIPNGELGVLIAGGASNNWVGGPYGGAYAGNVICASGFGGVAIGTAEFPGPDGSNDNHVEGNFIGTDRSETRAFGQQISGVTVQTSSKRNIIRKNVIVGHLHHGVVFAEATSNSLYGNWIGVTSTGTTLGNGSLGVYLVNATNNIVQLSVASAGPGHERNVFGMNVDGKVGVYGDSPGNVMDLTTSSRLLNISSRMRVETGHNALIAGFIITGSSPKNVIIRGIGTSLPVPQALADPTLELMTPGGSVFNDNWRSTQEQAIIASGIPPASDFESAIMATLQPGSYTAVMRGGGSTTGVGLLEVYDLDTSASVVLANISTRGIVQTGHNVMVAGFMLDAGDANSRIVVRALGPSLSGMGVSNPLNDPTLQLVNGNGVVFQQNDNWREDATQSSQLGTLSLAPSNDFESAIVAILPPGMYTAIVADRNGSSGTGLVEVYNIQ